MSQSEVLNHTSVEESKPEQRLSIANPNPKTLPGPKLLHELVSWSAGDAPMLEYLPATGDLTTKYSFNELRRCVESLATRLLESLPENYAESSETQPIIPVFVPQSPGLYISQLTTLEIGGAFCPINLDAPKERVKFICGDVKAKLLITTREMEETVTWDDWAEAPTVIYVDEIVSIPSSEEVASWPKIAKKLRRAETDELAYIMYTSGSTGLPKGVGVSHRAGSQSLLAHALFLPQFSRFLQFAAPSFDVSVFEIFFPMMQGKTLVSVNRPRLLNDLPGMINQLNIDACELTPTVAGSLLVKRSHVPTLKLLLTIGEMLTRPVVDEFGYDDERPGLLWGMYGPTEAAIHCTVYPLMKAGSKCGNIGVPFESVACYVAAIPGEGETPTECKILPLGEIGELVLAGPQLADGYLNRPKENAAAFISYQGEPVYRTGDKAKMLKDGTIEVMGRISAGQVKLRGQRVELGEIEEVVYKQKGIKMAFASVLQGMLVVFASTKGEHVSIDDLAETCKKWLPKYMVPNELVVMEEFPYLPSGKINKKKLEADYLASRTEEDGAEEKLSETEKKVSDIVKELLGFKVSSSKRLASAGMDSLMAIRFASQLKAAGLKITPVEILSAETVSAIAKVCDANAFSKVTADSLPSFDFSVLEEPVREALNKQGIDEEYEEVLPCTPLQDAMLLETAVDAQAYKNSLSLRIDGQHSEADIGDALQAWAKANPILRSGFADVKSTFSAYTGIVWKSLSTEQIRFGHEIEKSSALSPLRPLLINCILAADHVMLEISIHHALYDGWSLELLISDLSAILTGAGLTARPSFRLLVEDALRTAQADKWSQTQYWTDHLSSLDAQPLPSLQTKSGVAGGLAQARHTTTISTSALTALSKKLEVSPQAIIQAAYTHLLSSYLGTTDLCFGTIFSGRTSSLEGIADIAGPALSTLPVRIDTAGSSSMAELAQSLNTVIRRHMENDVLPLREIKKLSGVEGKALFDTLVIWQQTLEKTGEKKEVLELVKSRDHLEFSLTLEITPEEYLRLDANYQSAIFPAEQITLLFSQLEGLVAAFLKNSDTGLESFDCLNSSVLSVANSEPVHPEVPASLPSFVETQAERSPNNLAIEHATISSSGACETKLTSYGQLNSHANQIASVLASKNVVPDDLVCVCMEKSTELYTSILAVLKAGAGYLPITPDTPLERIQTIIRDAKVKIVLTSGSTVEHLQDLSGAAIINVDTLDYATLSTANLPYKATPSNLAYAVFTSGSTGVPKGVLVPTSAVLSNLATLKDLYPSTPNIRLLQSCSQGFDVSVFEIFYTFLMGGTLITGTKNTIFTDIERLVRETQVTHLSLTSTVGALIKPENVPDVKVLIQAGEALSGKVFDAWAGHEGKKLYNSYGPSETTNVVVVAEDIQRDGVLASIGKPLPTVSAFISAPVDEEHPDAFNTLPVGALGELCIGGSQVCCGYLDTAQNVGKFFEHPQYGRIYRTGDFCRLLSDGQIIYTGRKDDQVKIRGQRVELGETNARLMDDELVDDAVTLVLGKCEKDTRLVTFWTRKDERKADFAVLDVESEETQRLFEHLTGSLPIYMIPSTLVPVSCLPTTLVGKVDRRTLTKALSELSPEQIEAFSNSQAAVTASDYTLNPLELQIAQAVAEVANMPLENVGPNTSFFALGIDSISAISLVRSLREATPALNIEISDVLKHSSVSRLASNYSSKQEVVAGTSPAMLPTPPQESELDVELLDDVRAELESKGRKIAMVLPCTPLQEAMLSASELSSGEHAYQNRVVLDLKVSTEDFGRAWQEMVKRHEILRTCFAKSEKRDAAYSQVVLEQYQCAIAIVEAVSVAEAMAPKTSDARIEPPYSLTFVKIDGNLKLVLDMHHALYDGFAMSILYKEIEDYLSSRELPPPVSFAPFLRYMESVDKKKSDSYWQSLLKEYSPVPFTGASEKQNRVLTTDAPISLSTIESGLKTHSATLLSLIQSAWIATLATYLKSDDIVFGNVVSGRTVPVSGLNNLVAPCFNTIPFRVSNTDRLSFLDAIRSLQSQNIDALPYQLSALRRIQTLAQTDGKALFESLLLLQTPSKELDSKIWVKEEDEGSMNLPLVIELVPFPATDKLSVTLHTNGLPFTEVEVNEIMRTFFGFLQKALDSPRAPILGSSVKQEIQQAKEARQAAARKADNTGDDAEGSEWTKSEALVRDVIAGFTTVPASDIKRGTSIYRLGLDSINAVQVATALRKQGFEVSAGDVLMHPSIRELAAHIDTLGSKAAKAEKKSFDFSAFETQWKDAVLAKLDESARSSVATIHPCTPVQSGMLAATLHSGGKEYVNSFLMELKADISVDKIEAAWELVARSNPMLRTGFIGTGDSKFPFVMVEHDEASFKLPLSKGLTTEMTAERLQNQPWYLEHIAVDGKNVIRFVGHHALYDASSLANIKNDVQAAYNSSEIAPYALIRQTLEPILSANIDNEDERKKFWTEENKFSIARFPDLTPLHVSSTRSFAKTYNSKLSVSELERMAKDNSISVQAVGQTAWARLLSMYTGEPSVTFGVTLSGQASLEGSLKSALPTIVTLPVACDVVGTNKTVLEKTMQKIASVHSHQFAPLTSIQRWNEVEGSMFDTLFAYQKSANDSDTADAGKGLWKIVDEDASADYAVSIEMLPTSEGVLELCLTVKENIVPAEQAQLILEQFDALLLETLSKPEGDASLPGLEYSNETLLSITPPEYRTMGSEHMLLHDFVSRSAQLMPNKVALEFTTQLSPLNTKQWTYAEMEKEANRIANLTQKLGVKQGELVAICFDKCPKASFSIIGILKAGCAYVALDPGAPGERVRFIIEDSAATLILSSGAPAQKLIEEFKDVSNVRVVDLTSCSELTECSTDPAPLSKSIQPSDTSYCLYTSGTTGTPKGCELTHENAVQAMYSFTHLFADNYTPESKWLQFASFHFDVSVLEQFWTWKMGLCVASAPRDLIFEGIPEAIRALGITHIDLTPSLARLVTPDMVPSLKKGVFITGGEALRQDILDTWGEVGCIYNGYGPTEATIGCTMYPRVPANGKPANIGPQFLNVGSFVLKPETNEPVLRGAVGELVVSGKLVGKGYLNRAKLTEERFPTMFGEKVYRTGDLVRITHDGSFLFLGRADDQVKLRGQRLELSEITAVMKKGVPEIEDVVTLVLKHEKQQKEQLVAFFVTANPSNDEEVGSMIAAARQECQSKLSGYMVPTHFVPLERLPLSANNKADGKALAAMYNKMSIEDLQRLSAAGQSSRSWSSAEKEIIDILAECMSVEKNDLKIGTNIFELGYDSITVISLTQKLQAAGFPHAKLAAVMKNSSIEALVKLLLSEPTANQSGAVGSTEIVAAQQKITAFAHRHLATVAEELGVDVADIEAVAPCTAAQEGMIYRFLDSEEALYFAKFDFKLSSKIDFEKLEAAWTAATQKLEVLRMRFVLTDDGYAQVVLKAAETPFTTASNGTTTYNEMEKETALASPWKVTVNEVDNTMTLDIFHGLYDGVSLEILLNAVMSEYDGETAEYGPSFLSVLPHGPLASPAGAKEFWNEALAKAQFKPLPTIEATATNDLVINSRVEDIAHLEALRQRLGVTFQAIVQAAWSSTLQTYLNSASAPLMGMIISGRALEFAGADKAIGPLLNTLVFSAPTQAGMSWEDLISACHAFNTNVLPYQHTPLKRVMKWTSKGELFDNLFVFQHEAEANDTESKPWTVIEGQPKADYPLAFEATLKGDALNLCLVGQGRYLSQEVANTLLDCVKTALQALSNAQATVPLPAAASEAVSRADSYADVDEMVSAGDFEWTATAQAIRTEIAALAKVDESQVKPFTTLFSLGLDSIDVIKLASRLKNKGVKISVSALIKAGCVAKIAASMTASTAAPSEPKISIDEIEKQLRTALVSQLPDDGSIEAVWPATPLQEGMVSEMISSGYERYLNHELYKLDQMTNMEYLKSAWERCIEAHPVLRTTFMEVDSLDLDVGYAQLVRKYESGIWNKSEELSVTETESLEDAVQCAIVQAIEKAKQGSLLQLREVKQGDDEYYLLTISHALYDGWSLDALHADVNTSYGGAKLIDRPSPKNVLEGVINSSGPGATKYWKSALSGLPATSFHVRAEATDAVHRMEKNASISLDALKDFCKNQGISLQTLGQTAWALTLARYVKQLDVAFGVVMSCRDDDESRRVMLPTMNTVVVRAVLNGSGEEMLKYMQESGNAMRAWQQFPLRKAKALAANNGGDGQLFDTLFIFQAGREEAGGEMSLYEPVNSRSEVEFAVCVEMEIDGESLLWRTATRDSARTEEETEELLERLNKVLESLVQKPQDSVIHTAGSGELSIGGLPAFVAPQKDTNAQESEAKLWKSKSSMPWTETEKSVRAVLSTASRTPEDDISRETSIFHLGLDSISAIKVSSLLRRQGLHISVNEIIKNPTVHAIAEIIDSHASGSVVDATVNIDVESAIANSLAGVDQAALVAAAGMEADDVEAILPLSAGQLYTASRYDASSGAQFSAAFKWELSNKVDKERLNTAWDTLVSRHAVLRVKVVLSSGVQIIAKKANNTIVWDAEAKKIDFLEPVRLSVQDGIVKLDILHVLYDGMSLDNLLAELEELYHSPSTIAEVSSTENMKAFIASTVTETARPSQETFWKTYLTSGPPLPVLKPTSENNMVDTFNPSLSTADIPALARAAGVSVDAYILSVVGRAYSKLVASKGDDTVIGLYMANRNTSLTENLDAPTLNMLPLLVPTANNVATSAQTVQKDLGRLGDAAISQTRLSDIQIWTGVSVPLFVNLLKSNSASQNIVDDDKERLFVKSMSAENMLRARAEIRTCPGEPETKREGSFRPAIDVEVRVLEDGKTIDLGIFAMECVLSLEEAKKLEDEVIKLLNVEV